MTAIDDDMPPFGDDVPPPSIDDMDGPVMDYDDAPAPYDGFEAPSPVPLPKADSKAVSKAPHQDLGFRVPPHNYEAEKALLGALFANNKAYEKVSEYLRPEHFADPIHGTIYKTCVALLERGQIANPVTLSTFFERDKQLADVGGTAYLAELASSAVSIINAGEYGRIIYDNYLKRELIDIGENIVNNAHDGSVESQAMDQIQMAEQRLYDLATSGDVEGGFQSFHDSIMQAIHSAEMAHRRGGGLAGVTSGMRDLDKLLGGLHRSDLIILAGRPSMGKTALVTSMGFKAALKHYHTNGEEGAAVGFFSLEMSAEQLAGRILSQFVEVNSSKMRKGELSNEEFERLVVSSQELHKVPFYIDDTPGLTVSALRTRARRLKRQHGLGLIIIDYLQLMSGSPGSKDNRVQEISEISRGFKMLAKELDVPVIALSQLSRQVEQREDKRPQLSDLRESGSIEQDADVVMFVYRDFYYLDRAEPHKRENEGDDKFAERHQYWEQRMDEMRNKSEVIVGKQRHGPLGSVMLYFNGEYTQFGDLDEIHSDGEF